MNLAKIDKNILEKRFIRVLGITLVLHFAKVITDRIWLMNWDWTKVGKGSDGFNKVEIDSKRLIGGGVCMFVHVGPWCQLDAFYFHLFLEGDCFVNSFLLSHSLRKIRLKTVWSRPPNSSKLAWKATILLIWKVIQTHHHQPNHSNRIPTLCSRIFIAACWIITWNSESKISLEFHFRSEFKAGSTSVKVVISSKLNSNF